MNKKGLKNFRLLGRELNKHQPQTVAIELNNKVFAPLTDVQGSIYALIDANTKKLKSLSSFSAFGEEQELSNENPWRYVSKRFHPELNLINFGKRYYDPESGRYALNNPYSYYDPNGEFLQFVIPLFVWGASIAMPAISTWVAPAIYGIATGLITYGGYKVVEKLNEAVWKNTEVYVPDRPLPQDKHGRPIPDTDAPHTQLNRLVKSKEEGIKYSAIEALAKLYYEENEKDKSYNLLLKTDLQMLKEGKCLLCKLAFERKNYTIVATHARAIYSLEPSYEVALLNAQAFANLGQEMLAKGWQNTASQFSINRPLA